MPDQPGVPAPRQLVYTRLCDFRSMPGNPKAHDIPLIAASIDTHGFTDPVEVCERTGYVASGHGRVEALHHMRSTGYAGTPEGIVLDDDGEWCVPTQRGWASKDDDHLRAYVIGANKTGMAGGWDDHLLADMTHSLVTSNAELFDTLGFSDDDMDSLLTVTDPDRLDQGPEDTPGTDDGEDQAGGTEEPDGRRSDPVLCCPDCGSTFRLSESERP